MSAYQLYKANPNLYYQVGHYLSLSSTQYTAMGSGLNTDGWKTYSACFSSNKSSNNLTADQYDALMAKYL
ncbi:MAG: hypothetical protein MJ078_01965, partial [Clostridia bacterium]|nr:hypothetical protein [Clostridia bacterium]